MKKVNTRPSWHLPAITMLALIIVGMVAGTVWLVEYDWVGLYIRTNVLVGLILCGAAVAHAVGRLLSRSAVRSVRLQDD